MNNKYRGMNPQTNVEGAKDPEPIKGLLKGGIVLDKTPQDLELFQSPDLDKVRVHRSGLRADFATESMGAPAGSRILALGEHRFVDALGNIIQKTFRLTLVEGESGNVAQIEVYDHDTRTWSIAVTGDFPVAGNLHSWKSFFNVLFFAEGTQVYKWDNAELVDDEGNDFESSNLLIHRDDFTNAIMSPAVGQGDAYKAHFSVTVRGPAEADGSITIDVLHNGVVKTTKVLPISANSDTDRVIRDPHVVLPFTAQIADGDTVTLRLSEIVQDGVTRQNNFTGEPSSVITVTKNPARIPDGELYEFHFYMIGAEGDGVKTVQISADYGSGYEVVGSGEFDVSVGLLEMTIPGPVVSLKAEILSPNGRIFQDPIPNYNYVTWYELFDVEVHGFNAAVDGDESQGVTYSLLGMIANVLAQVFEGNLPESGSESGESGQGALVVGRYLGIFADRLLVMQANGDVQAVRYPINGDMTNWLGEGSGYNILISRSDPVDDIMGFETLSSNVGALFRKRSIMRAIQTGQVNPAIAFVPWIEDLGTESPFSICKVPGGILFLGNDGQVYLLTETGFQAIGQFIHESFGIDDLSVVEAVYDSVEQEYILSVPEASFATES